MFTLEEVAAHFKSAAVRCAPELAMVVETVVSTAAIRARAMIGHPQDHWPALSGGTVEGFRHYSGRWISGKAERGFSGALGYEPLRGDSGDLERSIGSMAEGTVGEVGSTSKIAVYQEMGTPHAMYPIPPRPFLAKALEETGSIAVVEVLLEPVVLRLLVPRG